MINEERKGRKRGGRIETHWIVTSGVGGIYGKRCVLDVGFL